MLDPATQRRVSQAALRANLAAHRAETQSLARALSRPVAVRERAEVELADGRRITLEKHQGHWRVPGSVLDFYPQSTPRDALKSFVAAVRQRRFDVLYALMPERARPGVSIAVLASSFEQQRAELEKVVALLETALEAPIEEVGDRATMPYGESFTVRFVRENGSWRIEAPD